MLAASILVVTAATGYAALCWLKPFGTCMRCKGEAERTTVFGRLKPCRRCRGTGMRVRVGRRAYTHWARLHERGTR